MRNYYESTEGLVFSVFSVLRKVVSDVAPSQKQTSASTKKPTATRKKASPSATAKKAASVVKKPTQKAGQNTTQKKTPVVPKPVKNQVMMMKPEKSLVHYEIELISLFAFTILSAVAIHTEWTGFLGSFIKAIYLGLFGFSGSLLTYAIFLFVFFQINKFFSDKKWRLIFSVLFAFTSIWIFTTTFNYSTLYESLDLKGQMLMSPEGMKASFDQGIQLRGGGVFGNILVFALINVVGKFGAYLLGTLLAALSIVLAFKVSLTNMVKRSSVKTYNGIKPLVGKMKSSAISNENKKQIASNKIVIAEDEVINAVNSIESAENKYTDMSAISFDDLPRKEHPIGNYNSDLYFEKLAEQVNLETGEYLDTEPLLEKVVVELEPEIEKPLEDELYVHFSVFNDNESSNNVIVSEVADEIIDFNLNEMSTESETEFVLENDTEHELDLESESQIDLVSESETEQAVEPDFEPVSYEVNVSSGLSTLPPPPPSTTPVVRPPMDESKRILPSFRPTIGSTPIPEPSLAMVQKPKPNPKPYMMPPLTLLDPAKAKTSSNKDEIVANVKILEVTLKNFGVDAKVTEVTKGPAITMYEILPAAGVKVSKIVNLTDDIALALAASQIRIIAPIPGKSAIGIEIPNKHTTMVTAREVFESDEFAKTDSKLSVALGKDITGKTMVADLGKMPHLLIAGSTGSGKSVCVNTIINSILFNATPDEVKLLMIDPKVVELSHYNGIPHLILPVVVDPKKAAIALNWAVSEMSNRYKTFAEQGVKDINSYNLKAGKNPALELEKMAKIVIIVDELADLMMAAPNQVEDAICRLAQMARAAGIHLIVATQRPSVDVITGLIKANIPSRIAFAVSSQIDSRTILDMAGAEKLLGKGDMLFYPLGANKPIRVQGAFLADAEVEGVVNFIKNQTDEVIYQEDILTDLPEAPITTEADEILKDAVEMVIESGQASISMIQRKFRVGYNRAARLIDSMEERGIVGPSLGSKPREVLITRLELEQLKL